MCSAIGRFGRRLDAWRLSFRPPMPRFGRVALIGRSNVGKSTLLNAALDEPLAIVSPLPQTTRTSLLGLVNRGDDQIAFLDTPGLHHPRTELGRRMNAAAIESLRQADVILFVTDVSVLLKAPTRARRLRSETVVPLPEDLELLAQCRPEVPVLLVVNKVDLVSNKQRLLPLLAAWQEQRSFAAILPVSCQSPADVERVIDATLSSLPQGEPEYPKDDLTDRPTRYFVAEYVREQVLLLTRKEVPHAVAVSIDAYHESEKLVSIAVTLHVEKDGQRRIMIGRGGSGVRAIGTQARARIQELVKKKVHLELFVKTNPRWKSVPRQLAELGYEGAVTDVTSSTSRGVK
jgi:GTPase